MRIVLFSRTFRLSRIVQHKHTCAYKNERDQKIYKHNRAFLGKHQLGENNSENRGHKAENRHLGNRVVLKKNAPERICDGGKEGEVYEDRDAFRRYVIYLASRYKSYYHHNRAAEDKLISADNDGIFILGEDLNKHRGDRQGHCREKNEAVARKVHFEIKSVKIYRDNSRKSDYAGNNLFGGKLLLLEKKAGEEDCEE